MLWNWQNEDREDPFAEIYMESRSEEAEHPPVSQKLEYPEPEAEEIRGLFLKMRHLGDRYRRFDQYYNTSQALVFCKQAEFMVKFEDDYPENAEFSMYFPDYQRMGYRQLRTYFTWRSKVRQGQVMRTSFSYVFLYLYELINNIGVESGEDGLEKLLYLWEAYRVYEPKLDKYAAGWVKDYYIVNSPPFSFDDLIQKYPVLQEFYAPSRTSDFYDQYASLSAYKPEKSSFCQTYKMEPKLRACFNHVMESLSRWLEENGIQLEDMFYYRHKGSPWKPFSKALYLPLASDREKVKTVRISDTELYWCRDGKWTTSGKRICRANSRQIIEYMIRRIEQFYRRVSQYKRKLAADRNKIELSAWMKLPGGDDSFFSRIDTAILDYYRDSQRISVTVDPRRLNEIRANALLIQEKLLSGMENEPETPPARMQVTPVPVPELDLDGSCWQRLIRSLNKTEQEALKLILNGSAGNELLSFAQNYGIMPEVLVDSLNEKALETVGDNIIELSDTVKVFEEYQEELERVFF